MGIEKAFLLQTHLSNHTLEMLASISYFEPRCPFKKAKEGHTTITLLGSDLRRKISRHWASKISEAGNLTSIRISKESCSICFPLLTQLKKHISTSWEYLGIFRRLPLPTLKDCCCAKTFIISPFPRSYFGIFVIISMKEFI